MAGRIGNTRLQGGDRTFPRDHPSALNGQKAKDVHCGQGLCFGMSCLAGACERHVVILFCFALFLASKSARFSPGVIIIQKIPQLHFAVQFSDLRSEL